MESDPEGEGEPAIFEWQYDVLRKNVPLDEAESSPQKLPSRGPATGGRRAQKQLAVDALRRGPREDAFAGFAPRERRDNGRDFLLERGVEVEVACPRGAFGRSPNKAARPQRQQVAGCIHAAKGRFQIRSHARIAFGPVELEEPAPRRLEHLVMGIAERPDPERRLTG